jgi:hypothetical protein
MFKEIVEFTKESWKNNKRQLIEVYGGFILIVLMFLFLFFIVLPIIYLYNI